MKYRLICIISSIVNRLKTHKFSSLYRHPTKILFALFEFSATSSSLGPSSSDRPPADSEIESSSLLLLVSSTSISFGLVCSGVCFMMPMSDYILFKSNS